MCGDIAVMLIPMPRGVGLGKSRRVAQTARRGAMMMRAIPRNRQVMRGGINA
jgi:hypothetical protein